jgi:hypothetical protein
MLNSVAGDRSKRAAIRSGSPDELLCELANVIYTVSQNNPHKRNDYARPTGRRKQFHRETFGFV